MPLVSDDAFDRLCEILANTWDEVTHRHKHLSDIHALRAGTGYQLVGRFPEPIRRLIDKHPHRQLYEVFNMPTFADKHEQQAYDIICILKYGSIGGSVNSKDIKRIGDYLRGGPIKPAVVVVRPPVVVRPRVVVPV